jgi:HEAT repeat protein
MGLGALLSAVLLFQVGNGSGMVYSDSHNQFYWCEQLESKNEVQRRQAVQPACSLLGGRPFTCRSRTITALVNCGDEAKVAIPVLTKLLRDQEPVVCSKAAWALIKMGPKGRAAVLPALPKLRELLWHESADVRLAAAEALGKTGPEGEAAATLALKELLRDKDPEVRLAAAQVLGSMGPEGQTLPNEEESVTATKSR